MQYILITGGNAGIGKATAIALAKKGARVIIACRNSTKGVTAVAEIKEATNSNEIYSVSCDLASFESVRVCAQLYRDQFGQLDILINNAGLITDRLQFTKEGFEMQFGVNHLGHFLLTSLLIDLLKKSIEPRIINVSSGAHYRGKINFNSFKGEAGDKKYNGMEAYSQSKLANVLFTKALAKRYPAICSHSLHPGVVNTEIAQKNENKILWKIMWKLFSPIMLTHDKGAFTSVFLASSPEALKTNGKYFNKQKETIPSDLAQDEDLADKLWEISKTLVE